MRFLLDSNTVSYLLRKDDQVRSHFEAARSQPDTTFILSPMVDFEIRRYLLLKEARRNLEQYSLLTKEWRKVDLTGQDWEMAAVIWAARHRSGQPIEDADLLIAVSALQHEARLVTSNTRHFGDLNLALVDWRQPLP